mmetsp:Transcript_49674/g.153453  ORF Transcript_49674/g.153453 Transcript_49674/m.153453 type:complete len:385 (-) Transcript_49674:962-2116(-)
MGIARPLARRTRWMWATAPRSTGRSSATLHTSGRSRTSAASAKAAALSTLRDGTSTGSSCTAPMRATRAFNAAAKPATRSGCSVDGVEARTMRALSATSKSPSAAACNIDRSSRGASDAASSALHSGGNAWDCTAMVVNLGLWRPQCTSTRSDASCSAVRFVAWNMRACSAPAWFPTAVAAACRSSASPHGVAERCMTTLDAVCVALPFPDVVAPIPGSGMTEPSVGCRNAARVWMAAPATSASAWAAHSARLRKSTVRARRSKRAADWIGVAAAAVAVCSIALRCRSRTAGSSVPTALIAASENVCWCSDVPLRRNSATPPRPPVDARRLLFWDGAPSLLAPLAPLLLLPGRAVGPLGPSICTFPLPRRRGSASSSSSFAWPP